MKDLIDWIAGSAITHSINNVAITLAYEFCSTRFNQRSHYDKMSMILQQAKAIMESIATLHIEKLPEGLYLATSDDIPGLVAQGRTIAETLEIARDIAKKLLEARQERQTPIHLNDIEDVFDYPLILGG